MIYLAIFLVVAVTGIAALWLHQRHQRMHLRSVHGFRSSLERISMQQVAVAIPRVERKSAVPSTPRGRRRPEPLDPARRAAAKRSLERRRAARA